MCDINKALRKRVLAIAKILLPFCLLLILIQIFYLSFSESGSNPKQALSEACSLQVSFTDRLILTFFLKLSQIQLYMSHAKCSPGNLNPLQAIQIEDETPKKSEFEQFLIKLDTEYILRRERLEINESSTLKCALQHFDKQLNKSDSFANLKCQNIIVAEVKLAKEVFLNFRIHSSGFYFVNCSFSSNLETFKPVYTEVISILPSSIKKLVERNKPSREETEKMRQSYEKLDSKTNPMLKDIKFEECEKLDGGELDEKMNVIVIGLDSVSYPNFKRVFPLTYKYLTNDLENNLMYENLNIVGENTYPNMAPLFSGVIIEESLEIGIKDEPRFFKETLNQSTFHDLYPFIWYDYEKLGYVTMYREDEPIISTFGFMKNGFR
jgi:hypothetical protein